MQGWVSVHRQIKENWIWNDKPFSKGQAWIDILLRVNHKENKVLVGNTLIEINPGETVWSIKDMAFSWGWSRKKVDTFLKVLETERMLHTKRTTKYTLVTVENWGTYQTEEHQKSIKRASNAHQPHTNNNVNNDLIKDIVVYLNEKAGTNYRESTKSTVKLITARINEGFNELDYFKKVIDVKCKEWLGTDSEKYLRPETLFGNKFEGYLNQYKPKKQILRPEYNEYGVEVYHE